MAVVGSTVVLTLAVPVTHNDTDVKVSYDKPTSGAVIEDAAGNDAEGFTDRTVDNNSEAPRVSIERVYADASPGIAHAEYRVTRSNQDPNNALVVNVELTQTATYLESTTGTITIPAGDTSATEEYASYYTGNTSGDLDAAVAQGSGYAPALSPGNSARVRMKVPASGRTLTISHRQAEYSTVENALDDVFNFSVTFTTGSGVARPREEVLVIIDTVDGTATGAATGGDFISVAGQIVEAEPTHWTASGTAFTATSNAALVITDDDEYEGDEQFTLRAIPDTQQDIFNLVCPPGTLAGTRGCDATITITDDETLGVSDVEVTSTPTGDYYGATDAISITVTFNGKVTVTGTPRFAFDLGGATRQASYASGSDSTELVFSYTVLATDADDHDGISWGANALSLNSGTIKFMHSDVAQQVAARLSHPAQPALPAHKSDTQKPALDEAEVDESTLSMFFTEDLNTTAPANSAFTVKVDGGTGANPTAVSISGSTVTLTLASPVTQGQTATVSYAKPSANPIKDLTGKEADSFTDRTVDPASDIENFRATPGNRRVRLDWDNPSDSTIRRYQYRYMNTSDSDWNPDWRNISSSSANTTSFTATGLTNGIEYTFQVRPMFRENLILVPGKEGEIKSIPRGPLRAPGGLTANSAGDGEIALSWNDPGDITITGYQYRYRKPSDTDWNPDWTQITGSGATTTSHTLPGLENNVRYTIELRAMRGTTGGPAARAFQKPRGPLVAPGNFAAASGQNKRATLSWDNSGDDSVTRFQYRYRISTVSAWNPNWTDIPGSRWNTTSYRVTGLVNQTGYTFELRALRGTLDGPSSSDTATPEGPPSVPLPPQDLTVYPADRSLGLSWEPPVEEDSRAPVTGYSVRYREAGRSWRTVSRQSANLARWQTISGLRNGRTYEVRVASVNRVGTGSYTGMTGTPEAPELGEPPPEPEGDENSTSARSGCGGRAPIPTATIGAISGKWTRAPARIASQSSGRVPEATGTRKKWAAHIALSGEASGVSYSFRRSPDTAGDYYEMNGTARLDGPGYLSIRVRGRYGTSWGAWSPAAGLYCMENQ